MATTVLVADDHTVLAESLALALRQWYRVPAPVTSMRLLPQAVAIARPDAVLLDLTFGKECSLSLFPNLIALSPSTRFIAFTNHDEEAFAIASRRAGLHAFLIKTVSMDAVRQTIEDAGALPATVPPLPFAATPHVQRAPSQSQELVRWLLASAYSHATIAALVGITVKGVEYHAARMRHDQVRLLTPP